MKYVEIIGSLFVDISLQTCNPENLQASLPSDEVCQTLGNLTGRICREDAELLIGSLFPGPLCFLTRNEIPSMPISRSVAIEMWKQCYLYKS